MKTSIDCFPCLMRQALQAARISGSDQEQERELVLSVADSLKDLDVTRTPPELAMPIYEKIVEMTGCEDPYLAIKEEGNQQALAVYPQVEKVVLESDDRLLSAARFAIAGNIIDYGAAEKFDVEGLMEQCQVIPLAVDHSQKMKDTIGALKKGDTVLYLHDNCGEIVYDKLVLEYLKELEVNITMVVRGGAIINDATLVEAEAVGLDKYGMVISNGVTCPGTPVELCSEEFLGLYNSADLIISKGQGNFESLSEVNKGNILFLLTVKCAAAGRHFSELIGVEGSEIPGKGEMAIYFPT